MTTSASRFAPRAGRPARSAVLSRTGPFGDKRRRSGGRRPAAGPISHRNHRRRTRWGPTEYRLLQFFHSHQERKCHTCGQLLDFVAWGGNAWQVEERTVDDIRQFAQGARRGLQ